jgi:excinuclease ABC subunit C
VVRRRFTLGNARSGIADATGSDPAGADSADADPAGVVAEAEPTYRRGIDPETGRPRRFAYPPQLLVVDGGAPQVNAAATELAELGIVDVTICGLAKRLEEVWVPAQDEPIIFPRTSEALYLLQRLRDEAHRFAITYHRAKRSKSMTVSALDNVAGLGDVRRKALIRHFGSVAALRRADVEEVLAVPGLGRRTAEAVVAALADQTRPSRTATEANPIPSTGTQDNAAPVNGIGDGVRGGA